MNTKKQEYMERVKKHQRTKYEGFGESHHLREWERLLGVPHSSMHRYLGNGLTIEEIAEVRGVRYNADLQKHEEKKTYSTRCPKCGADLMCLDNVKNYLDHCPICGEKIETK